MVRLRRMEWDNTRKAYTFTTEEDNPITIIWTPDHSGVNVPSNTGNQARPVLPSTVIVDPLPESTGITTTTSPAPEEKNFADYILILPMPNIPPIYIYLSKPPVEFLEVELYSDFKRRSREGKYEADHMPSAAAVREYLKANAPEMLPDDIDMAVQNVAAIVVPKAIHQKLSETYGGRNTRNDAAQIKQDALDLRAAVDRNLDAIKPALKNHGATESQIEAARTKMHKLNSDMGLYK
ncbi:PAAR/S-type pyocin domain-containing protein [Yersinia pekkanenii]|uniref:PAAR/S-type pyocin domain-containing protein n=2 Tax=Yersinia pekkanenii TaxID=1288385 RepID=A0ABM9TWL5_9GAMM|nr:PAAR/S-type pyocin domain-containing protein [Yersinia pekkanenii]